MHGARPQRGGDPRTSGETVLERAGKGEGWRRSWKSIHSGAWSEYLSSPTGLVAALMLALRWGW
jgi:hypothetical protein